MKLKASQSGGIQGHSRGENYPYVISIVDDHNGNERLRVITPWGPSTDTIGINYRQAEDIVDEYRYVENLADIANQRLRDTGGFSLNFLAQSPYFGYMVSLPGEVKIPLQPWTNTYSRIFQFIDSNIVNIDADYFGGWTHDNHLYLDVSRCIMSRSEAIAKGREWNQRAIYDARQGIDIHV